MHADQKRTNESQEGQLPSRARQMDLTWFYVKKGGLDPNLTL